jgi:hypothetical protein
MSAANPPAMTIVVTRRNGLWDLAVTSSAVPSEHAPTGMAGLTAQALVAEILKLPRSFAVRFFEDEGSEIDPRADADLGGAVFDAARGYWLGPKASP